MASAFFGLGVRSRVPGMPMPVCPARLAGLLISGRVPVVARDASWRGVQAGVVDGGAGDAGILRIDTPY